MPDTPRQRHKWDKTRERRIAACEFADGCSRTFRVCAKCGLQKVTVIPPQGFAYRAWATADDAPLQCAATPPCHVEGT